MFLFIATLLKHIHTLGWSHWFHAHIILPKQPTQLWTWSKLSIKKPEQLSSKAVFVLHGGVLTGFIHSFKKQLPKVFYKKDVLQKLAILLYLFNNIAGLQASNFITNRIHHRFFPVNIAKFSKTSVSKDICERLFLNFIDSKWKK